MRRTLLAVLLLVVAGSAEPRSPTDRNEPQDELQKAFHFQFVEASVGKLRQAPNPNAKLVKKLPIATRVEVFETREGWAKVAAGEIGWISESLLAVVEPTVERMLAKYNEAPAGDLTERRKWAERAAALAPSDLKALDALIEVLDAVEDREAYRRAVRGRDIALQSILPFYEFQRDLSQASADGELQIILSRNEKGKAEKADFYEQKVSVIGESGVCEAALSELKVDADRSCCQEGEMVVVGVYPLNAKCTGIGRLLAIAPQRATDFTIANPNDAKLNPKAATILSHDFVVPEAALPDSLEPINEAFYGWQDGALAIKYKDYYETKETNITRDRCTHQRIGAMDVFYCPGKLEQRYDPMYTLLYTDGRLIFADLYYPEWFSDGFGVFENSSKKMVASYVDQVPVYALESGEAVYEYKGRFHYYARKPILYYGECDCP